MGHHAFAGCPGPQAQYSAAQLASATVPAPRAQLLAAVAEVLLYRSSSAADSPVADSAAVGRPAAGFPADIDGSVAPAADSVAVDSVAVDSAAAEPADYAALVDGVHAVAVV